MPLRRIVAELPEGVDEICLVRFGIVAARWSAVPATRRFAREVAQASQVAIETRAGLLGSERVSFGWKHVGFLQYWASFEALDTWSHTSPHATWWKLAVERMRVKGDIGVYHEAYVVARSNVESIYLDCTGVGLSAFGVTSEPVGPKTTARDRLGRRR